MYEALVITPVKDSLNTTLETIQSIHSSNVALKYIVFNDFSAEETTSILKSKSDDLNFELINLSDITDTPSPNYRLVLKLAQKKAIEFNLPLIIIESDVEVKDNTIAELIQKSNELSKCGMIGSVTINSGGEINFPYLNFKKTKEKIVNTNRSLSFCCTLLTIDLLKSFDFDELSTEKHWYDVFISRKSKQLGFNNYLAINLPVLHKPHSSRPWKQLKYENPLKYYFQKLIKRRDKI